MALGGGGSYGNNEVPNDTLSHPPPKAEVRTSEGQLGLTATMEVENPPNEIEVNGTTERQEPSCTTSVDLEEGKADKELPMKHRELEPEQAKTGEDRQMEV
jgi:hypothetical protein